MAPFKFLAAICLAVVAVSPSSATVFLAGDSTTANDQGTAYTGWGSQLGKYLSVSVSNNAVAGKSSRSFTDQGYFSGILNSVRANDLVIIEFGHNEGGGPAGNPQQGVCPGTDLTTTCKDGSRTVYTYHRYMSDAIKSFLAKNANVIVSSQTPNNPFRDNGGVPVYVAYAQQVAALTNVTYINHFNYTMKVYNEQGASKVNGYFPQDNIHTNTAGADIVAQALVRGALCGADNALVPLVKNKNVQPAACIV